MLILSCFWARLLWKLWFHRWCLPWDLFRSAWPDFSGQCTAERTAGFCGSNSTADDSTWPPGHPFFRLLLGFLNSFVMSIDYCSNLILHLSFCGHSKHFSKLWSRSLLFRLSLVLLSYQVYIMAVHRMTVCQRQPIVFEAGFLPSRK